MKITKKDLEDYKHIRLTRPSAGQIRKYYSGFRQSMKEKEDTQKWFERILGTNTLRLTREKKMFDDELKDLSMVYKITLSEVEDNIDRALPRLLQFMKEFIHLHDQKEMVEEKLENLLAKFNPEESEDE